MNDTVIVRDGFTMPSTDLDLIHEIKERCLKQGISTNKSEIVRAGIQLLSNLSDEELSAVISALPKLKLGRPKQKG